MFMCKKESYTWKSWGESTLQWPQNVVTNIIFQNYVTCNSDQANIKGGFPKLYSK